MTSVTVPPADPKAVDFVFQLPGAPDSFPPVSGPRGSHLRSGYHAVNFFAALIQRGKHFGVPAFLADV